ncbi:MAG TPA: response regulator [Thermoanaerobaculia bacterium]|jgi:signal transduction histidine kinase|nr:response regulator [Thermoanaerobaculia bacterium]
MSTNDRVNILLVDDQPGKLLTYEAILSQLGENLIKASSGREALEHLLKTDITVVLMDVSMPELDGFELAEIIRQHPRYQKTAIIFVSAVHLSDLDRLRGYASGAVDYVSVPIVPELLRAKVSVFTELYRKTRESERLNQELEQRVADRTAELEASTAKQIELARQLQEADHRKDEFIALLAHELRNPLAPIQNAVNIMRIQGSSDPDLVWCRDVIERQVGQLTRLVDDLLDVSRITQGKIKLRLEPFDLLTIVHRAVETSQPLIDSQRHRLEVSVPDVPVQILGDPARLTQVIANLLNNAASYQDEQGEIGLKLEREDDFAVIHVTDRGIGIAPEILPKIFELFLQGDLRPSVPSRGGLGIGLSLVKNLVEMHGGTVFVNNNGAGRGSDFVVRLPVLVEASSETQTASAGPNEPRTNPRQVLVVDDNGDAAKTLAILLRLQGHEVRVALDGPSALESVATKKPEIVLLDLLMPGIDGYEICRRMRQEGLADARIIAMTGFGQDRDRQRSKDAGFDHHLVKPVAMDELLRLFAAL